MNITDTRRYEMLVRVRDFGAAHPDIFPADSLGGQMFAAVTTAAATVAERGAVEMSSRSAVREGVLAREAARARLLTVLEGLRRTAQAVALDTPGVDGKFRRPSSRGARTLAMAARSFALDAHALSGALIAHGLPATFLDTLDAAILAFEVTIQDHARSVAALVASRAAIETAMQAGLTAVQRLDAIVQNLVYTDSGANAVWQQARHVEQPPRARNRARKPAPAPASPAAPVPPVPDTPPVTT